MNPQPDREQKEHKRKHQSPEGEEKPKKIVKHTKMNEPIEKRGFLRRGGGYSKPVTGKIGQELREEEEKEEEEEGEENFPISMINSSKGSFSKTTPEVSNQLPQTSQDLHFRKTLRVYPKTSEVDKQVKPKKKQGKKKAEKDEEEQIRDEMEIIEVEKNIHLMDFKENDNEEQVNEGQDNEERKREEEILQDFSFDDLVSKCYGRLQESCKGNRIFWIATLKLTKNNRDTFFSETQKTLESKFKHRLFDFVLLQLGKNEEDIEETIGMVLARKNNYTPQYEEKVFLDFMKSKTNDYLLDQHLHQDKINYFYSIFQKPSEKRLHFAFFSKIGDNKYCWRLVKSLFSSKFKINHENSRYTSIPDETVSYSSINHFGEDESGIKKVWLEFQSKPKGKR